MVPEGLPFSWRQGHRQVSLVLATSSPGSRWCEGTANEMCGDGDSGPASPSKLWDAKSPSDGRVALEIRSVEWATRRAVGSGFPDGRPKDRLPDDPCPLWGPRREVSGSAWGGSFQSSLYRAGPTVKAKDLAPFWASMRGVGLGPSILVLTLVFSLLPSVITANEPAEEELPPLRHVGGGEGAGWVMYRYDANEAHIIMDFEVPTLAETPIRQFGAMGYDSDLNFLGGALLTRLYGDEGVYVDSKVFGEEGPIIDTYPDWSSDGTESIRIEMNRPGSPYEIVSGMRYTLIWGVGAVAEHTHSFYAADDVVLYEVEEDLSATLFTTADFDGSLAARASMGPVGARALADGSIGQEIEHDLVGIFEAGYLASPGDALLTERPDGSVEVCTCDWLELREPYASGPGAYGFSASGAVASPNGADHVRLTVVDVRVPNKTA